MGTLVKYFPFPLSPRPFIFSPEYGKSKPPDDRIIWWAPFMLGIYEELSFFQPQGMLFFLAFFWLMIAAEQSTLLLFRQLFFFCGNISWIFPDTDETWRLFVTGKIRNLRKRDQRKKTLQGGWTENTLLSVPNKFNSLCSPTGKDTSGKNRQPLQPFNSHGGWNGKKVF